MIPIHADNPPPSKAGCSGCHSPAQDDISFEFAYQPIVDVDSRSIYAFEALVRGPEGQPAASVLAQVNDSNRYRFDQACRMKAVEGAARLGMTTLLSINFLPNAVYRPEVCIRSTFEAARTHGFPVENIIFEVTEGEHIEDRPHLVNIFEQYRRFGFQTAIDDFGAGYAGLNLLAEYQPDIVKIDMDLVRHIDSNKPRQSIVAGIIQICRELDIRVLAEGIETRAERDFLMGVGVNLMQGYWFARPALKALPEVPSTAWA
jgi:EAL domain-containing protein (putative c-di-GMP-specific phosphodiesterase class I)